MGAVVSIKTLAAILLLTLAVACSSASTATPPPPQIEPTALPSATPVPSPTATRAPATPTPTPHPTVRPPETDSAFIQLIDPLDEPQFYCLDVPGQGTAVRLNSPLHAHTCKPIETAEDELFALDHPTGGQIFMEAYDLCLEASGSTPGSTVMLQVCDDLPNQMFSFGDGVISLESPGQANLCLAVAPGPGIPTGGPSHLRRDLTLENCDTVDPGRSRWISGIFDY